MKRWMTPVGLLSFFLLANALSAQSLAEIAAKEKQRRAQNEKESKNEESSVKVIDNQALSSATGESVSVTGTEGARSPSQRTTPSRSVSNRSTARPWYTSEPHEPPWREGTAVQAADRARKKELPGGCGSTGRTQAIGRGMCSRPATPQRIQGRALSDEDSSNRLRGHKG